MDFINRQILPKIQNHLQKREITLLLGPRQTGKTTIMLKIKQQLTGAGKNTVYFNLDNFDQKKYFISQDTLVNKLKLDFGAKFVYVFIDEIQRLKNAGLFLKGFYDMHLPYKLIVTGSGSLELKADIIETMTGRKRIFYVLPLNFTEFISYKSSLPEDKLPLFFALEKQKLYQLFNQYITFGGYPKVVLAPNQEEKIDILSEIYKSYIEKDVKNLIGIEKDIAYQNLIRYLSASVGCIVNRAEIGRNLNLSEKTVNNYLDFLEKTFIISIIHPFYKNITKELTKSPKIYFMDLGLRNFATQIFQPFDSRTDKGLLFENFIFLRLLELNLFFKFKFWRTQSGAEVDFVLESKGQAFPIEVKSSKPRPGFIERGFGSFLKKYKPEVAYIYNLETDSKTKKYNTSIIYLPYYKLPKLD